MAARGNDKAQRVDHGGNYRQLPVGLLDSEAWGGLSMRAQCIAIALLRRFSGFNNGAIAASARDIAEAIKSHRYAANRAAIGELVTAGIATIERVHPKGSRMATEYRLTFIESGDPRHRRPATNDWRWIHTGSRRKNLGDETSTRNGKPVDPASTERKRRDDAPSTDLTETSHFSGGPPADDASTLIVCHSTDVAGGSEIIPFRPQNAGGPKSTPTCAMDVDELRAFTRGYINSAEPGSQTRLAAASGVPGGTLSKFLAGKGLATHHLVPLQIAVGRAWPMDQRPIASAVQ